jgi:probable phosphoglycerate mutase
MSGRWKIKHPDMLSLGARVQQLIANKNVQFLWIPREQNVLADALANKAMDGEPAAAAAAVEFNQVAPSSIRAPQASVSEATTLIMVRHGRTALTESRKISGGDGENPDLSELGVKDASEVATELSRVGNSGAFGFLTKPVVVIHSPIKRAAQTASMIAKKLDAEQIELPDLREISFGDWDGLTNEELFVAHEQHYQSWRGSYDVAPPGGESLKDFDVRVIRALDFILEKFAGKTVVLVAHVMPIRGLLRIANDAQIAGYWRVNLGPASISIARFWGREAAEVVCVNSTSHLSS